MESRAFLELDLPTGLAPACHLPMHSHSLRVLLQFKAVELPKDQAVRALVSGRRELWACRTRKPLCLERTRIAQSFTDSSASRDSGVTGERLEVREGADERQVRQPRTTHVVNRTENSWAYVSRSLCTATINPQIVHPRKRPVAPESKRRDKAVTESCSLISGGVVMVFPPLTLSANLQHEFQPPRV